MSNTDAIILIFVGLVMDAFFGGVCYLDVYFSAKSRWKKNCQNFPYFTYPAYKKLFFLGLKGAMNGVTVFLTFVVNLSFVPFIAFAAWYAASAQPVAYVLFCVFMGVHLGSLMLRCLSMWIFPLNLYETPKSRRSFRSRWWD